MSDLKIRPFTNSDATLIKDWCEDKESYYKWCVGFLGEYPLTAENLLIAFADKQNKDGFIPFTVFDGESAVGFFSLRKSCEDAKELRFCFVIVSPEVRGKGYGKEMLKAGIKFAKENYGATKICLNVFENNPAAIRCYKAIGFAENGKIKDYDIMGEKWKCIGMTLE